MTLIENKERSCRKRRCYVANVNEKSNGGDNDPAIYGWRLMVDPHWAMFQTCFTIETDKKPA